MLNPDRCASVLGPRQQCELPARHDGDHVHGVRSWPPAARESAEYRRGVARLRALRRRALQLRSER